MKKPNQSPEPTVMAVTSPADAGAAPATTVAHITLGKNMWRLLSALTFIARLSALGAEQEIRVLASVRDIREGSAPILHRVDVDFVIHAPSEFAGLSFVLVTDCASRKVVRSDFPIGHL